MVSSISVLPAWLVRTLLVSSVLASPLNLQLQSRQPSNSGAFVYQACYTEATGMRALSDASYFDDQMTVEMCATACKAYTYMGVEYGRECYCGNQINTGSVPAPATDCNFQCPGNPAETCGAGNRLNLYKQPTTTNPLPESTTFLGCYSEATTGRALNSLSDIDYSMTVELCASYCSAYHFFGLEYHHECYCGNELQPGSAMVDASQCKYACDGNHDEVCGGDWILDLYVNNDYVPSPTVPVAILADYSYQGCYTEATNMRALSDSTYYDDAMTREKCASACVEYAYFGVEYGRECYCGNTLNAGSVLTAESDCYFQCPGDNAEICGAGNRLNVFEARAAQVPLTSTSSSSSSSSTAISTSSSSSTSVTATSTSSSSSSSSSATLTSSSSSSSITATSTSSSSSSSSSATLTSSSSSGSISTTSISSSSSSSSTATLTSSSSSSSSTATLTSSSSSTVSSTSSVVATSTTTSIIATSTSSSSSSSSPTTALSSTSGSVSSSTSGSSTSATISMTSSSSTTSTITVVPATSTSSTSTTSSTTSTTSSAGPAVCTPSIVNGGFESGSLAPFTTTPASYGSYSVAGFLTKEVYSGYYSALLSFTSGTPAAAETLQISNTISICTGQSYTVSFAALYQGGTQGCSYTVYINGLPAPNNVVLRTGYQLVSTLPQVALADTATISVSYTCPTAFVIPFAPTLTRNLYLDAFTVTAYNPVAKR